MSSSQWPLWEVFTQKKAGLPFEHAGSVHAPDKEMALQNARDVYSRRNEATCLWVVLSEYIVSSSPEDMGSFFDPARALDTETAPSGLRPFLCCRRFSR